MPVLCIHAPGNRAIINGLTEMGAGVRQLGNYAMLPAVMDFRHVPAAAVEFKIPPARPLKIADATQSKGKPLFSLAV
jgi:hypothetical protein